nr:MAG TPA: hypothetical protein [Caudoviricetes sp.]
MKWNSRQTVSREWECRRGFLLKCFPTASNHDNARAATPYAAAAQVERRSSQARRLLR